MCGISCIIDKSGLLDNGTLSRFTDAVAHRGPDGRGFAKFADSEGLPEADGEKFYVGLGHRRLSIIDLSEAGSQPMFSADKSHAIVYNGEIYNHIELRRELENEGVVLRSHCDTEVVLEAYRRWGAKCLSKFNGMWAFVILDRKRRKLILSRDRIGVKPLYFLSRNGFLAVGSELKQFFALPDFKAVPNRSSCLLYLTTGYEAPPETFFSGVFSFPPSSYAEISLDTPLVNPVKYWDPDSFSVRRHNYAGIVPEIGKIFSSAVNFRLRSDVPVGGCLSGGLDSSSIFAEMKNLSPSSRTFSAFSACFEDPAADERPFMKKVIDRTSSVHVKVFPNEKELVEDLPAFLRQHDEPVGSISMYAQYKIMQAARENKIPVLLDGQGGDELFSGYWPSYMMNLNFQVKDFFRLKFTPPLPTFLPDILGALTPYGNPEIFRQSFLNYMEYRKRSEKHLPFEIKKKYLPEIAEHPLYSWHMTARNLPPDEYRKAEIFKIHLPRLLKWEDRNSMAFSIESRVPFLDVRLVELLLTVKPEMNMKNGWTKYLFRKAMDGKLPSDICWRKDKKGFETPQEKWMKSGPFNKHLISWASEKNHPVSEFISDDFQEIQMKIIDGSFDATRMFRLFCMDYWMKNIASR
ncbi:MAG TPA: asparagine synthase (glutamine-hydrolyzing) [Lentisphaeria bacterium]|nr:MAG: asparagine synthase (glutamine-hydrolyzing) [Lentisphaerae bacterium GWF2_49_21]HBC87113.1 asparagine synthase (glutamine-hydrolyzing) [Lentisphaeria bacterium]